MNVNLSDDLKQFLCEHWSNAHRTIIALQENLSASSPWSHQYLTSSGTYLGDIYKAIENSLRVLVEEIDGQRLAKNDRWHQTLLEKSFENGLIPINNSKTFREMLRYRHFYVHGYAMNLDESVIRESSPQAIRSFYEFVEHLKEKFDIPQQ